jgi:hypothetical protein
MFIYVVLVLELKHRLYDPFTALLFVCLFIFGLLPNEYFYN